MSHILFEASEKNIGPNRLELERGRGPSHARAVRERLEQRPGGIRGGGPVDKRESEKNQRKQSKKGYTHDRFVAEVDKLPVELLFLEVKFDCQI